MLRAETLLSFSPTSRIVRLITLPLAFPAMPARSSQSFSSAPHSSSICCVTSTALTLPSSRKRIPVSMRPSSAMRARVWVRNKVMFSSLLSAPRSISSAAARSVAELVFEYWKQPVSVLTAA